MKLFLVCCLLLLVSVAFSAKGGKEDEKEEPTCGCNAFCESDPEADCYENECAMGCKCYDFSLTNHTITHRDNGDGEQTTFRYQVCNNCRWAVSWIAIGTGGNEVIWPPEGSKCGTPECPRGGFNVVYTNMNGNPGFPSVKWESSGEDFKSCACYEFEVTLAGHLDEFFVQQFGAHSGGIYEVFEGFVPGGCDKFVDSNPCPDGYKGENCDECVEIAQCNADGSGFYTNGEYGNSGELALPVLAGGSFGQCTFDCFCQRTEPECPCVDGEGYCDATGDPCNPVCIPWPSPETPPVEPPVEEPSSEEPSSEEEYVPYSPIYLPAGGSVITFTGDKSAPIWEDAPVIIYNPATKDECEALNDCSGNGVCSGTNDCTCFPTHTGADCSEEVPHADNCPAAETCEKCGEVEGCSWIQLPAKPPACYNTEQYLEEGVLTSCEAAVIEAFDAGDCPDDCNELNGYGKCDVTTGECVCNEGYDGINCGDDSVAWSALATAATIGAGIIALIVFGVIVVFAAFGGAGYAMYARMDNHQMGAVSGNPLFKDAGGGWHDNAM